MHCAIASDRRAMSAIGLVFDDGATRNRRSRWRGRSLISAGVLLWTCAHPCAADAEQAQLTFVAGDGLTFLETLRIDHTVEEGQAPAKRTLFDSKGNYTIRKTDKGYSVYLKPVKPVDMVVSDDVAALAAGAIMMNLRYDLDREWRLTGVAGVENSLAHIENILPPELRPLLTIMGVTPENMKQMVALDWKIRGLFQFAQMSGRTFPLNTSKDISEAMYPSALGTFFMAPGRLRATSPIACGKTRCFKIESTGASNDPALGHAFSQYLGMVVSGIASTYVPKEKASGQLPRMRVTDPSERVTLSRVVDPNTGLHHVYTQEHDLKAMFRFQDDTTASTTPVRIKVKREYTYQY
jgi:hypothetical protein